MVKVLLCKDTPNPYGMPGDWPDQTRHSDQDDPGYDSAGAPWVELSEEAYADYIAAHQSDFDQWHAGFLEAQEAAKKAESEASASIIQNELAKLPIPERIEQLRLAILQMSQA